MAKHPLWSDEYWLLLMQLYLKKPVGVKPLYSRGMVNLSLEVHIPPRYLQDKMICLQTLDIPHIEQLWNTYGKNPKKLSREVDLLRRMKGFNHAEDFYAGVEINESFEKDFRPLEESPSLTPVILIMVLDLYFHLTPFTMDVRTPEVTRLARLVHIRPELIVEVLSVYQFCDPCLHRKDVLIHPLLIPCQEVWQRYGNGKLEDLSMLALQLEEYFKPYTSEPRANTSSHSELLK